MEKSKKIFVFVLPDHGHINPIACAVAQFRLDYPQHEIIFYGTPLYKPAIERSGCTYREYPNIPPDNEQQQPPLTEQKGYIFSFNPLDAMIKRQLGLWDKSLPGLIEEAERDRPDLIIYDVFAMQAKYLLRAIELRYKKKVSTFKPPPAIMFATTFAQKLGVFPTIAELKTIVDVNIGLFITMFFLFLRQIYFSWKHGLDIYDVFDLLTNHDEETVIVSILPEFQPKRDKFDEKQFKFVGSCVSESVRTFEVKDEKLKHYMTTFKPVNPRESITALRSNDRKLVYASLGTVANNNPFLFEHIINTINLFDENNNSTIKSSHIELIISTGVDVYEKMQAKIRSKLLTVPSNVLLQPSVPQLEVLKRASLFITHGGMNSANEAILYGVPVICIPIMV
jgi:hypothetical protein